MKYILIVLFSLFWTIYTENFNQPCTENQVDHQNFTLKNKKQCIQTKCIPLMTQVGKALLQHESKNIRISNEFTDVTWEFDIFSEICKDPTSCNNLNDCFDVSLFSEYNVLIFNDLLQQSHQGTINVNYDKKHIDIFCHHIEIDQFKCVYDLIFSIKNMDFSEIMDFKVTVILTEIESNTFIGINDQIFTIDHCLEGQILFDQNRCIDEGRAEKCGLALKNLNSDHLDINAESETDENKVIFYKFFIEYLEPYYHNPNCVQPSISFQGKKIRNGLGLTDEWKYNEEYTRSEFWIRNTDFRDHYNCPVEDLGDFIRYNCTVEAEYFFENVKQHKQIFNVYLRFMKNIQNQLLMPILDTNITKGIEKNMQIQSECKICQDISCSVYLDPKDHIFYKDSSVFLEQKIVDVLHDNYMLKEKKITGALGSQYTALNAVSSEIGKIIYEIKPYIAAKQSITVESTLTMPGSDSGSGRRRALEEQEEKFYARDVVTINVLERENSGGEWKNFDLVLVLGCMVGVLLVVVIGLVVKIILAQKQSSSDQKFQHVGSQQVAQVTVENETEIDEEQISMDGSENQQNYYGQGIKEQNNYVQIQQQQIQENDESILGLQD